jgi:hypothetical protein
VVDNQLLSGGHYCYDEVVTCPPSAWRSCSRQLHELSRERDLNVWSLRAISMQLRLGAGRGLLPVKFDSPILAVRGLSMLLRPPLHSLSGSLFKRTNLSSSLN